jgi:NAD(P)-dependent dehydrogenase (short-subunit alcohol dehydrogenase family)
MSKIALVTGANRGLGLETCRQLAQQEVTVILTARNQAAGEHAVQKLAQQGLTVHFHPLEVTNQLSCEKLYDFIVKNYGRLDILVNNAGIFPDHKDRGALEVDVEILREAMETNLYAPFRLCKLFIPLMLKHNYGRIVNLSSGMGQLTGMNGGCPGYRTSKTALNALTCLLADELKGTNVLVNSLCPGWVKTDMGGAGATRELPEGVETIVWLATLPDGSPSGGFFRDRQIIPW